jgi:DNA invertase Pin-like site-specific DNA recombinase
MRVALYARVSTSEQDAELQLVELRRYVTARGWDLADEFVDRGVSGAAVTRPARDQLLAAARRRVATASPFARSHEASVRHLRPWPISSAV